MHVTHESQTAALVHCRRKLDCIDTDAMRCKALTNAIKGLLQKITENMQAFMRVADIVKNLELISARYKPDDPNIDIPQSAQAFGVVDDHCKKIPEGVALKAVRDFVGTHNFTNIAYERYRVMFAELSKMLVDLVANVNETDDTVDLDGAGVTEPAAIFSILEQHRFECPQLAACANRPGVERSALLVAKHQTMVCKNKAFVQSLAIVEDSAKDSVRADRFRKYLGSF